MWSHIFLFGSLPRRRLPEFTAILMFEFWREATANSLPGLLCQSGRRRPSLLGTLRSDDGDGNGNATKAIGLISKTTILRVHHAFLYFSLPSLHDYDVKIPNFPMYTGSTQATKKFPLSFWTWIWFLGIQLWEGSSTFDKVSELE